MIRFPEKKKFPGFIRSIFTLLVIAIVLFITGSIYLSTGMGGDLYSLKYDISSTTKNIVIIIPGMNQSDKSTGYADICRYYEKADIMPVFVNINWKKYILKNNKKSLYQLIKNSFRDSNIYIFGFSVGASEAFKLSQQIKVKQVILCSMSPVFKEDREFIPFPFKQILNKRSHSSESLSLSGRGKDYFFLYGDHDSFVLSKALIKNRNKYFTDAKTVIVSDAGHNISNINYLAEVEKIIKELK